MLTPIAHNIEHYMDLLAQRQKLVASNLANLDTPGYHTKDLDFQFEYMSLMETTSASIGKPACWPKTACASTSRPISCAANSATSEKR